MTEIRGGVALRIIGDRLPVVRSKQILPRCVAVGVRLAVLFDDVAVVVILHRIDNFAVYRFGKKLTERIVGIFRNSINRVGNLGNALFGVILVGESSSTGQYNLAHKLRGGRGFQLFICYVLLRYIAGMVMELTGYKACTKLELVENLAAEGVVLGVTGYRSAACEELHNGVVIICLVVDGLSRAGGRSDDFLGYLTFGIVIILYGMGDNLGGYDFAGKSNIRLGSTDDSAFLILIIILFFGYYVNRTDDVAVASVDIEKLRTSFEVRR